MQVIKPYTIPSIIRNDCYPRLYRNVSNAVKEWSKDKRTRSWYAGCFYYGVGQLGKVRTEYVSLAASQLKNPTPDHFFSPRLIFRAMMAMCPELLRDRKEFYTIVDFCRLTIDVTSDENAKVKYGQEKDDYPLVKTRTIDKYDDFGWILRKVGMLKETNGKNSSFPLKHLIPDWLTAFEEKCMRHHGYL